MRTNNIIRCSIIQIGLLLVLSTILVQSVRFVNVAYYASCDTNAKLLRVMSVPENLCIDIGQDYWLKAEITNDGSNIVKYNVFFDDQCYFETGYGYNFQYGICSNGIAFTRPDANYVNLTWSYGPQLPTTNYYFSQQAELCPNGMAVQEVTINQIWDKDTCVFSSDQFPNTWSVIRIDSQGLLSTYLNNPQKTCGNTFVSNGVCPTANTWMTSHNFRLIGSNVAPDPGFSISPKPVTFDSYTSISGSFTFSGNWHSIGFNFIVNYKNANNQMEMVSYLNTGVTSFSFSHPGYPVLNSTQIQIKLAGVDLNKVKTIPSATPPQFTIPRPPIMNNITIIQVGVTTAKFEYYSSHGLFGKPTTFSISLNGANLDNSVYSSCFVSSICPTINTTCTDSKGTCVITGLTPGSNNTISIFANNFGAQSSVLNTDFQTLNSANVTQFSVSRSLSTSIAIYFSIVGGVPNDIQYSVLKNGSSVICEPSKFCLLTQLSSPNIYNITVILTSDGATTSNTIMFKLWDDISSVIFNSLDKTTKTISINYSGVGGDPSNTKYNIYDNSKLLTPQFTSNTSFFIPNLLPGTLHSIQVSGTYMNRQVSASQDITTYASATAPVITLLEKTYRSAFIEMESIQGIPNQTTYSVYINETIYQDYFEISSKQCNITGLSHSSDYNVKVVAINDGDSFESVLMISTVKPPNVINFNIVHYTTKTVTFNFDSIDGLLNSLTTFIITVDGNTINNQSCTNGVDCFVGGLTPGKNISISIQASNSGESGPVANQYVELYNSTTQPSIDVLIRRTDSISVVYSSQYGVPSQSVYTVRINNTDAPNCVSVTTLHCSVSGLQENTWYEVQVIVENDGETKSTAQITQTYPIINSIELNASPRTTQLDLTYSVKDGYPSDHITYIVYIDGSPNQCVEISSNSCSIFGLKNNTQYSIRLTASNDDHEIEITKNFTTFDFVSSPVISSSQINSNKTLLLNFPADNGVPGETLYNVSVNGQLVDFCTNISKSECTFVENSTFSLSSNVTFSIEASNDGHSSSSERIIETYEYLSNISIEIEKINFTEITIRWNQSTGGIQGMTLYSSSISSNGNDWNVICSKSSTTTCAFNDLKHNTQYFIKVEAANPAFSDSLTSLTTSKTPKNPSEPNESSDSGINNSTKLQFKLFILISSLFISLLFI